MLSAATHIENANAGVLSEAARRSGYRGLMVAGSMTATGRITGISFALVTTVTGCEQATLSRPRSDVEQESDKYYRPATSGSARSLSTAW